MGKQRNKVIIAVFLVAVCFAFIAAGEYGHYAERKLLKFQITDAGDTARVFKVNQFTARDGFAYIDSFQTAAWVTGDFDSTVTWTSPKQVRRVLVAATVDTAAVESILVDLGTNKHGVTYTVTNKAWTRAELIDTLVALFNAVAEIKDTVLAQDSSTYIKLVSKIAQDALEGDARWTIDPGPTTQLTEGDSTFTTKAMVCDSMSYYINENDSIGPHVTAANSGDTVYTVTANKKGVDFLLIPGDTAQDTSTTVANATSASIYTDSFILGSLEGFSSLQVRCIIKPPYGGERTGLGILDSGYIWLYSVFANEWTPLDSAISDTCPDTLDYHINKTAGDTVLGTYLGVKIRIWDSCSDTNMTVLQPFDYDVYAK